MGLTGGGAGGFSRFREQFMRSRRTAELERDDEKWASRPMQQPFSARVSAWSERKFDAARVAAGHVDDRASWH